MQPCYRIAGLTFGVRGLPTSLDDELGAALRGFESTGAPAVLLECAVDGRPPAAVLEIPEVVAAAAGHQVRGPDFEAWIAADRSEVRVGQSASRFPTETVLKLLIAERVLAAGGLLVHSSALAHEGRAALFAGESGAGKSTLAAFGRRGGLDPLSDELVAVYPADDGTWRAEGTPWNVGAPASARLAIVGLLAHAPDHRLEPCPAPEVLRTLLPNCVLPDRGPAGRARAFQNATALLSNVRTGRLYFARDTGVGAELKKQLAVRN